MFPLQSRRYSRILVPFRPPQTFRNTSQAKSTKPQEISTKAERKGTANQSLIHLCFQDGIEIRKLALHLVAFLLLLLKFVPQGLAFLLCRLPPCERCGKLRPQLVQFTLEMACNKKENAFVIYPSCQALCWLLGPKPQMPNGHDLIQTCVPALCRCLQKIPDRIQAGKEVS